MTEITYGATLDALRGVGVPAGDGLRYSDAWRCLQTPRQRKSFGARNLITPTRWSVRLLAGGQLLVEVSYGTFLGKPLLGCTVYHVDPEQAVHDNERSQSFHDLPALVEYLRWLDEAYLTAGNA